MDNLKVKVSKVKQSPGLMVVEVLSLMEVYQVFVVGEDLHRKRGSVEIISPGFQGANDSKEFTVIDVIVMFYENERLGEVHKSKGANHH